MPGKDFDLYYSVFGKQVAMNLGVFFAVSSKKANLGKSVRFEDRLFVWIKLLQNRFNNALGCYTSFR